MKRGGKKKNERTNRERKNSIFLIKLRLKSSPVKWNFTDSGRPARTEEIKSVY